MTGLLRAEWLRFGHRRVVWAIAVGVLILSSVLFLLAYNGTRGINPVFDEATSRQQALTALAGQNLSPDELARAVDEFVAQDRQVYDQIAATYRREQMRYAFPESVATALGATGFVDFALILLAAIMLGDEFSAGTIRTLLVAVADRRRILLARLLALGAVAVLLIAGLAALGVVLPLLLGATGSALPAPTDFDPSVIARLAAGAILSAFAVVAFATLVTALLRSGALTLVVALVYVVVELAAVDALTKIPGFRPGDSLEAATRLLPMRSILTLLSGPESAASEMPWLPLAFVVVVAWGLVFAALAVVRFGRMDIVE